MPRNFTRRNQSSRRLQTAPLMTCTLGKEGRRRKNFPGRDQSSRILQIAPLTTCTLRREDRRRQEEQLEATEGVLLFSLRGKKKDLE